VGHIAANFQISKIQTNQLTRNQRSNPRSKAEHQATENSIKRERSFDELDVPDPGRLTTFKRPKANLSFVAL
jgi:hypothetical protein